MATAANGSLNPGKIPVLRELHTDFCNANNPITEVLNKIQDKVDELCRGKILEEGNKNEPCEPYKYGGMIYEFEIQKNIATSNLRKAEKILKDLTEII